MYLIVFVHLIYLTLHVTYHIYLNDKDTQPPNKGRRTILRPHPGDSRSVSAAALSPEGQVAVTFTTDEASNRVDHVDVGLLHAMGTYGNQY